MKPVDYTKFNSDGKDDEKGLERRWWLANKGDRAQAVHGVVGLLSRYDHKRQAQYQVSARLYGNVSLMGVTGLSMSKSASTQSANRDRISYNVIQSAVDTLVSKMGKNKPKPMFLTSGGDWKLQRRAKKLDKFMEGVFYENGMNEMRRQIRRDAYIFGDGFVHVFEHNSRVKYERVLASELFTDWVEAFYGEPRQLHRIKTVDREVLMESFPAKAKAIQNANAATAAMMGQDQNVSDQVMVVESWHLPSGPDAKDGLHSITIEDETLFEEEWDKDFFPFARRRWCSRLYGYWSQGIPEQIQNIQLEMNKILWIIQRSMQLAGSFKVFLKKGSKVVKEHLNNDIGAIVEYLDTEPKYVVPPIVPMELYTHLRDLKGSAFEQVGISQLSAQSQKPAGLNSGKALREFNDIESDRFLSDGQDEEAFVLELAKLSIDCAKGIYKENKKMTVKVPGKKFIESIDWKDVDLEQDEYIMKMFPVSSLPSDPAGRLQTIQEYVQAGMMSVRTARRLLDFPDLEQVEELQDAQEDYLNEILEKMTDDGIYTPPEPFDDLALAKELALEYYSQGKLNNLEEDKLELIRTFLSQIDLLNQKANPPAPQGLPGAGPTPQAAPMAQPQSDLVPNVPVAS